MEKEVSKKKKTQAVKKVTSKKKTNKKVSKQEMILLVIFISLIGLCVFLGVKVAQKQKEESKVVKANIVIPIMKKEENVVLNIDLNELSKQKEYVIKITNYRGNEIIQEDIPYSIIVENKTDTEISLTRNDMKNNLITNQKETTIDTLRLYKGQKEEVIFHIKMTKKGKIKEKEVVTIYVRS